MTHLERFNAWLLGEGKGMTYVRAVELAVPLGHDKDALVRAIREIRHWLAKNEDTGKANKKLWGKFFLTWLSPKNYQQGGRLEPSSFDE